MQRMTGLGNTTSKVFHLDNIIQETNYQKIVWILNEDEDQKELYYNLQFFSEYKIFNLTEKNKLEVLAQFVYSSKPSILVAFNQDLANQKINNWQYFEKYKLSLVKGASFNFTSFFQDLIAQGYIIPEDEQLKPGHYRRQGEIIEVFPINLSYPLRIVIDFDRIENIFVLKENKRQNAQKEYFKSLEISDDLKAVEIYPNLLRENILVAKFLKQIKNLDLLIYDEIDFSLEDDLFEEITIEKINILPYANVEEIDQRLKYSDVLYFYSLREFEQELKEKMKQSFQIFIVTKKTKVIQNILREKQFSWVNKKKITYQKKANGVINLIESQKKLDKIAGFQDHLQKILVLTDNEIFQYEKLGKKRKKLNLGFLSSLKPGDFVVHIDYGIGLFEGLVTKTIDNFAKEYFKIAYAKNDLLFIPIDHSDKIAKYVSENSKIVPKLTRLGTVEWERMKTKVKKETVQIARELLELYATREQVKVEQYKKNNQLVRQFEDDFIYKETEWQQHAIVDVYKDLESSKPMDRLICGDVGFGKTEIALRAAFKVIVNGYQVVILAPITILANQHFKEFKARFAKYGLEVRELDRFIPLKEQRKTIADLKKGKVDLVVGTHRLLGEDLKFKKLGLVVIDEEQRFGVKQKEKLKEMKKNVNILSMSATPIPRTLNMALNGVRDVSNIYTPPRGRLPVISEVRRFSFNLVRDVVLQEINRQGQIYIIHNRIETIDAFTQKLKIMIPEARFIVCHGKLSSMELSYRIAKFQEGKYDVLVSSTIIENGIDLPKANSLIVNNAENFWLAQLHQLRGRVGRSNIQAFAYFMYHSQKLKPDAKKRLKAIMNLSELGSWFQVAMADLEIRGGGNILGKEQHGVVKNIGVTHFSKLLKETVEEIQTGKINIDIDVNIELPINTVIASDYIQERSEKLAVYQKIAKARTIDELRNIRLEVLNTYGELPLAVNNIFELSQLKILCKKAKVENIVHLNGKIVISIPKEIDPKKLMPIVQKYPRLILRADNFRIQKKDLGENWLKELAKIILVMG